MRQDMDFANWDPLNYLKEYFPPNVDNEPAVRFIVQERLRLPHDAIAVDVGCGPTVCYWSALAPRVQSLLVADYLERNLHCLHDWITCQPDRYDWASYTRLILEYEGKPDASPEDVRDREALARKKVSNLVTCDITKPDPLGITHRAKYDCVISVCCADSITNSKLEWKVYMRNIFSLLKPGGLFIGSAMRNCTYYQIGNISYPAANVNEVDFYALMLECGFDETSLKIEVASESQPLNNTPNIEPVQLRHEYDQIILASGVIQ